MTQIGLVALRMEGELIKPLQVPAMRDRRQREYAQLAADYLCSNLDWYLLTEHLDPFTIPIESLADQIVTDKLGLLSDMYSVELAEWIKRHQIAPHQIDDYLPTCCNCNDTGEDYNHGLHNPSKCTQCSKGKHR